MKSVDNRHKLGRIVETEERIKMRTEDAIHVGIMLKNAGNQQKIPEEGYVKGV